MQKVNTHADARLERALRVADMGYFEWEIGQNDFYLSPNAGRMLGHKLPKTHSPLEFHALLTEIIPKELFTRMKAEVKNLLEETAEESELEFDVPIHNSRGTQIWLDVVVHFDHRRDGGRRRISVTFYDITKIREEEQEAVLRAERSKRFVNSMPTGVIVTLESAPRIIVHVNDAAAIMLQASTWSGGREIRHLDLRSTEFTEYVHQEDKKPLDIALRHSLKVAHMDIDILVQGLKGSKMDAQCRIVRSEWEEKKAIFIFLQDVTNIRKAEREVMEKNRELESFTYSVSHDLRSPLITMRGYLGYVEKEVNERCSQDAKEDMLRIVRAAERLDALLADLLDYSRIGRQLIDFEKVSITAEARRVTAGLAGLIEERRATVFIASKMPPVIGIKVRISQLLQNLIENALKFTVADRQALVEVGFRTENKLPVYFVRDNGIGIGEDHRERIFGLFHKLDAETQGSGVGLALAQRIVETHGGRIWIENNPGTKDNPNGFGSTFCFTLSASQNSNVP